MKVFVLLLTVSAVFAFCPDNCKTCSMSNVCQKCQSGFFLDNLTCKKCSIEECSECPFDRCEVCKEGYKFVTDDCYD